MRLLIFLVLSQNALACKCGIISKYQYIIGRTYKCPYRNDIETHKMPKSKEKIELKFPI